jgi:hypothetical protein
MFIAAIRADFEALKFAIHVNFWSPKFVARGGVSCGVSSLCYFNTIIIALTFYFCSSIGFSLFQGAATI